MATKAQPSRKDIDREFLVGLGRAYAGAFLFALPILMTMEMWALGVTIGTWRLAALLIILPPVLVGLSRFAGFRVTVAIQEDIVDALVAIFVAATAALLILYLFGLLTPDMSTRELVGKIVIQIIPGSIGAMLARSQLGERSDDEDDNDDDDNDDDDNDDEDDDDESDEGVDDHTREPTYIGELFLMAAGALFLQLSLAPTEEVVLIAYQMTLAQEAGLLVLSLLVMHGFVYRLNFAGGGPHARDEPGWQLFLRYTVVGYVLVLFVSTYLLWTFGRIDGASLQEIISTAIVLGFPGAIGGAAARLIL